MKLSPLKLRPAHLLGWKAAIRWKYVLPRLSVLVVIGLVLRLGLDPALRAVLEQGGAATVGARVEVASLTTALLEGELVLEALAIANPRQPLQNVLIANRARLQLDTNALLHGQLVVTTGRLSGLEFGTPRTTSGALEKQDAQDLNDPPRSFQPLLDSAGALGERWLDELVTQLDTNLLDQLESPRVVQQLHTDWTQQQAQLQQQIVALRAQGKTLEQELREAKTNPLRGLEKLPELGQQLTQLQQEAKSVQQRLAQLPAQAKADKLAVLTARKQDETLLRQKLQLGKIDEEGLTQTLLGGPVTQGLTTALDWIAWARQQVPSQSAELKTRRGRGTTVRFGPARPACWIRQLQLEGQASLGGAPLALVGALTNASSAPQLLPEPMQLSLRSDTADSTTMTLSVTMDRRGPVPRDHLAIDCPSLQLPTQQLGKGDKLAIRQAAGIAQWQVELEIEDQQLAGTMTFVQPDLALQLDSTLSEPLQETLGEALAGVRRLEANVGLTGTLSKPKIKIDSDLGAQVANSLQTALGKLLKQRTAELLAKNRQQIDQQLQQLTQLQTTAQQTLSEQLGKGQAKLEQLAGSGIPAGIPQLGRQLRLENLKR